MDDKVIKITASYRGRDLSDDTVRARMEEADPGTGWDGYGPLLWSCPRMAQYALENIQYTLGPKYDVRKEEIDRV